MGELVDQTLKPPMDFGGRKVPAILLHLLKGQSLFRGLEDI